MKKFKKNTLSTQLTRVSIATIMAMTTMSAHASTKQIGDLEIYQPAKSANTNLMMMLDTSGSMGISSLVLPKTNKYGSPGDVDKPLCGRTTGAFKQWIYNAKDMRASSETYNRTAFKKSVTVEGETINYYLRGCGTATIDASGKLIESESGKFDRLSRLKESLIQLIASGTIDETVSIGLGNFSSKTPIKIGDSQNTLVDGHSGTILVPVKPLTKEHRLDLIRTLAAFKSVDVETNEDGTANPNLAGNSTNYPDIFKAASGTPTAHAYAEAGAYMLGTGTGRDSNIEKAKTLNILYDGSVVMQRTGGTEQVYYICVELGTADAARQFGATVRQCANGWNPNEIRKDTGQPFGLWYDGSTIGPNIPVYKPNSNGGWTPVSRQELIRTVGRMSNAWETHSKLPVGWRYAGWMKVDNEPMDIEPINTKGWDNPGGATAYVSYRASPFIVTSTTEGAETCDAGYAYRSTAWDNGGNYKCKSNALGEGVKGTNRNLTCPSWYIDCQPVQSRTILVRNNWGTYSYQNEYYRMGYHLKEAKKSTAMNEYRNNIGGMRYAGIKHDLNGDGVNELNVTVPFKNDDNYQEPDNTVGECSSNGIYFLTDGAPNSTTDDMAEQIINRTLGNKTISSKPVGLTSPALTSGLFPGETGGWEYIGEYAKRLREPTQNPSGVKIRTAVAGFGASFAGLSSSKNENGQTIYNCDSDTATADAKNACRWGNIGSGYGEGGFFYTQSADDIAKSIKVFLNTLNTSLPTAPAGTITIPDDPYQASSQQAIAFLPMLQPDVSSASSIWQGNLKKYEIGTVTKGVSDVANEGTFFGKNKAHLYQADGVSLSKVAQDFWSDKDYPDANDAVTSGGVYANLKLPNRSALDGVRTVFVEDGDTLKKFGVNASGKLTLNDNELSADNTFADTKLYTPANVQHLLRFLGFVNVTVPDNLANTVVTADNIADSKIMGGVVHSSPSFVSYSAKVNADGEVTDERDEYVLFGSMDGALHMVDSDNFSESGSGGKEQFAIITKQMLLEQPEALSASVSGESEGVGKPKFGVDAPWLVTATYTYQDGKLVAQSTEPTAPQGKSYNTLSGVNAFGGFRLGAKGLYGLDLTDKNEPILRFAFLPTSEGADRLGYIWNKPTLARIKTGANDMGTDVLVFGGGYDMCYEDENFQVGEGTGSDACKVKPYADGSAIYIINAKTGALIWKASSETIRDMKHSIVGEIAVLDRNNDGFMDHLYAADLGGQIFRADFTNASSTRDSFAARGVVRVFHEPGEGVYTRRFYEKPQVNIYTETKRFATVSVISGDRSSPLSKLRGNTTTADRLYTLFDTDITKTNREFNALTSSTYQVKDITPANLEALGDVNGGQKDTHLQKIKAFITNSNPTEAVKKGWYYPLNRFDGYTNVRYGKGVGKLEVVSGLLNNKRSSFLYTTVYNPDMSYTKTDSCSAQIKGGSERQFYCMPWGICENTSTGLAGYQRAGIGIQELARGPASKANSSKVLLSSMLGAYHAENNYNKASSSIVTAQSGVPNPNGVTGWTNPIAIPDLISGGQSESTAYTLTPKQWYDVSATK